MTKSTENTLQIEVLSSTLAAMQGQARSDLQSSLETRKARIQQVIDMLVAEEAHLTAAIDADYQGRSRPFSVMTDIVGSLSSLKYTRDNLHKWIAPETCEVIPPYDQMGAQGLIVSQPKGVVAIMGTWNCPVYTVFSPMACVIAAGNRVIVKPSEVTPHTAQAIADAMNKHLDPDIFRVITGDAEVSKVFVQQPWDHLVFTGSTPTGKKIMAAAAENLVPLTLELGGKSPAIVGTSANVAEAARRLAIAKGNNNGQICISPDTVYVQEQAKDEFCLAFIEAYQTHFPTLANNPDVVPIVNQGHCSRIKQYIDELASNQTEVRYTHKDDESEQAKRLSLAVVINPPLDSAISKDEIFGPAIIVRTYGEIDEVINILARQEKPLALYYFGQDESERDFVVNNTSSGGVTINDALTHAALHDGPFGGVGASGMGHYHGIHGFKEFSHQRTVFVAPDYDFRGDYGLLPPYSEQFTQMMLQMVTAE